MKQDELSYYYSKFKYGETVYHQLMRHRVKEILLVSSLFDSYVLEKDSKLSEQIYGDFRQLDLMQTPRITSVSITDDIPSVMSEKKFDIVVLMMRVGTISPFELARKIKEEHPNIPILLLLNKQSYIDLIESSSNRMNCFDDVFIWKGDSKVFMAMIKSVEDKMNAEFDAEIAGVRIVLFVESSIDYYSTFLPLFYTVNMALTQELINSETDFINKRLKMRARPKILMAHDYEDALELFKKHKENLLCVVSNANLRINNVYNEMGGIRLFSEIRSRSKDLPLLLQSADENFAKEARKLNARFLYKFSPTLMKDLKEFITNNLGFGDFVFRDKDGKYIGKAKSIYHLEKMLKTIPEESLLYHAKRNHFSAWMMAHGEVQLARIMKSTVITDFINSEDLRRFLVSSINKVRQEQNRGKVVSFGPSVFTESEKITQLASGSLGGKGRGLSFLNALLVAMDLEKEFDNVRVKIPRTAIIGVSEFDRFMEINKIDTSALINKTDEEIDQVFMNGIISDELKQKLIVLLKNINQPLAVRSSGLLEDSQSQPFAGIYRTYMLPNNADFETRLKQLCDGIKMVFASPFQLGARKYIESINYKIEEEKMAVVIQEIVGTKQKEQLFYPHFSGAAQSYNFYPISDMQHSDGIAAIAVGMGRAVVDGERAFRFCPRYPRIDLLEPKGIVETNQKDFYGVDLSAENIDYDILKEDTFEKRNRIRTSHLEEVFKELTSVWDYQDFRFLDGKFINGPRIITFRNMIHYDQFPLADILKRVLEIGEIAFGVPVEIEFAVTLQDEDNAGIPIFNLLQIRPLSVNKESITIELDNLNRNDLMLITSHGMGNGIIDTIKDVIFIDPEKFDNTQTLDMAQEITKINSKLNAEDKEYILIGPGRWGTSDRFLGIPVRWDQINKARIIVEATLENFAVEASQGSHFFHNLVAMNAGYFNVSHSSETDFIDWEWLHSIPPKNTGKYYVHLSFQDPLIVKIDGKSGFATIDKHS